MSRRRAFWIGVALLIGTLFPLFVGELRAGEGAWFGVAGGIALLAISGADQLVGRALHERRHPLGDAALVLLLVGLVGGLWANFLVVDAWHGWWGRFVLIPIVGGTVGLPVLKWLSEGFRPTPFWTMIGALSGISSSMLLFMWRWNKTRYDFDAIGPEEWVIASLAASSWVLLIPLLAIVRLGREPVRVRPRRWIGAAIAGALVGVAHADAWTLVRYDRMRGSYSSYGYGYGNGGATDAYTAAAFGTILLVYALGPTAISRLIGVAEAHREPIEDDDVAPAPATSPG
jgi:hypothetical protein